MCGLFKSIPAVPILTRQVLIYITSEGSSVDKDAAEVAVAMWLNLDPSYVSRGFHVHEDCVDVHEAFSSDCRVAKKVVDSRR